MILDYIINHYWLAGLIIVILYVSDYYLTLLQSKMYHAGAKNTISLDGGIELNPQWQKDIQSLKKINPKFIIAVFLVIIMTGFIWLLSKSSGSMQPFEIVFGGFVLMEFFIHTRHFKSLFLYKSILQNKGVTGYIAYSRFFAHKSAAIDAMIFAVMYSIFGLFTNEILFFGGAVSCLSVAFAQKKWLKKINLQKVISTQGVGN